MKKDGFTLVELLAVIIIIGVIASIAIVSVDKTLKNSKNNLYKVQVNNIIKAAKAYYIKEGMDESNDIQSSSWGTAKINSVACINLSKLIDKGYIESNEVINPKTKNPMNGSVNVSLTIKQNKTKYSYEYRDDSCAFVFPAMAENKTLAGKIPRGNFEPGDEYIVNVDDEHQYHFYVLSTEGDKVTLIMSNNICSDGTLATSSNKCTIPWISKADYSDDTSFGDYVNNDRGPITAMNYLHEATKNWSNIDNIQMNYVDENPKENYGYGEIKTSGNMTTIIKKDGTVTATYNNLKARIPKSLEISKVGCKIGGDGGVCPSWLVNGLFDPYKETYPSGTIEYGDHMGYWTLNSEDSWVGYVTLYSYSASMGDSETSIGIRPVIEVSKSALNGSDQNTNSGEGTIRDPNMSGGMMS